MSAPENAPAPAPVPAVPAESPHEAMKAVRSRQIVIGVAFFAVGLELIGNQGAWFHPHTSYWALGILAVAMILNWSCPKCRAYLWSDTTRRTATSKRPTLTCWKCGTRYP